MIIPWRQCVYPRKLDKTKLASNPGIYCTYCAKRVPFVLTGSPDFLDPGQPLRGSPSASGNLFISGWCSPAKKSLLGCVCDGPNAWLVTSSKASLLHKNKSQWHVLAWSISPSAATPGVTSHKSYQMLPAVGFLMSSRSSPDPDTPCVDRCGII